jgi:predicted cation transporter
MSLSSWLAILTNALIWMIIVELLLPYTKIEEKEEKFFFRMFQLGVCSIWTGSFLIN